MISRRPKSLASSDKDPGPSRTSAAAIDAAIAACDRDWSGPDSGNGINDTAIAAITSAAAPLQAGVRKPLRIPSPVTDSRKAIAADTGVRLLGAVK